MNPAILVGILLAACCCARKRDQIRDLHSHTFADGAYCSRRLGRDSPFLQEESSSETMYHYAVRSILLHTRHTNSVPDHEAVLASESKWKYLLDLDLR